ncbi:MAG: ABC transporter permease [Myxococcales bacterium]|nr:ABC transporter permease [Polyangiaceae bacterium]MDW8252018.1 ABC transporter permease [Myxococcales bacterium]
MIGELGRWGLFQVRELLATYLVPYAALKGAWLERGRGGRLVVRSVALQIYYSAVEPLPVFLLIGVSLGFFVVAAADGLMRPNGLAPHVPTVVAQSIVRELLPITIAVILTGRSGTAISTELGYMRVTQEIEALEVAGVNVDYFLVLPRMVGLILSSLGLTVCMGASALLGGYFVAQGLNLASVGLQLTQILGALTPATVGLALLKSGIFGLTIGSISCFHGMAVERHFAEIPRANVRSSARSFFGCFVLNAVISVYALSQWR